MVRNGCAEMEEVSSQALKRLVRGRPVPLLRLKRLQEVVYQEIASITGPGGEQVLGLGPAQEVSDLSR